MRSQRPVWLLGSFVIVLAGCGRDEIQTYRAPKESPAGSAMMQAMQVDTSAADEHAHREIEWKVPSGWKEQAASGMRTGSFLIKGANGQEADMSVVALSGEAGGDLANINRWRSQIGLESLSQEELSKQSRIIQPAGRRMLLIDYPSQSALIDNRFKKRVTAAIYKSGPQTWFFKMIGEDATVKQAIPSFIKFLESLHFHEH